MNQIITYITKAT